MRIQTFPGLRFGVAAMALMVFSATAQTLPGVHPSFTLATVRPMNFELGVSGLDFLSDGRLVVATYAKDNAFGVDGKPTDIMILNGVKGTDRNAMTATTIASNFIDPHGLVVVHDSIYVFHKHQLTLLADDAKNGTYTKRVKICDGWQNNGNFHQFEFGLLYRDGWFYGTLGNAWTPENNGADRGNMIRMPKAGGAYKHIAGGFREPNGVGFGPEGEMFVTDNQGEWLNSNKLVHV